MLVQYHPLIIVCGFWGSAMFARGVGSGSDYFKCSLVISDGIVRQDIYRQFNSPLRNRRRLGLLLEPRRFVG